MAFPNKFRFYFYSQSGSTKTWYFVDSSNIIQTTNDNAIGLANPLQHSPNEWDGIEQSWERSESMHGIFTKISNEYSFSGDGAKILRHFIFTFGYSAKLKFAIYILDSATMTYSEYLVNDVNFNTPPIDEHYVKISLFEKGIATDIKSNYDTPYEIPLEGADVVNVYHTGTLLKGRYNYRYGTIGVIGELTPLMVGIGVYLNGLITNTNNDGLFPIAIAKNSDGGPTLIAEYTDTRLINDQGYVLMNKDTQSFGFSYTVTNLDFEWRYIPTVGSTITARLEFFIITQEPSGTFTANLIESFPLRTLGSIWQTESVTDAIGVVMPDLTPNRMVYFAWGLFIDSSSPYPNGNIEIRCKNPEEARLYLDIDFQSTTTIFPSFRNYKLIEKLVEKFADGKYASMPFVSSYLSSPTTFEKGMYPYKVCLTNGLALKGVTSTIFKTSFKVLFEDLQARLPVGMGVINGNQIYIERIDHFYDFSTVIADIGELTDWSISPLNKIATNLLFSYKYNDNDILNGEFDFNTASSFKSELITPNVSKLDFSSKCVSSIYSIEKIRVAEFGKDTTGDKINEDLYLFDISDTEIVGSGFLLRRPGSIYYNVYDVLDANTAYNVIFSPANNAERLKPILNSYTAPSTQPIVFQKSDRYSGMSSEFYNPSTGTFLPLIEENGDIIPDTTDIIWLPFSIKCRAIIDDDLITLFKANPYGVIHGTINGNLVEFFVDSIKFKPSNYNTFDIEGRLSPNTNIANLI